MKQLFLLLISLFVLTDNIFAQNWDSPETESVMRTLFKQIYQVKGKVYGSDDFEPKPYALQGADIKVTCVGDTANMEGMAAQKDGGFDVYLNSRERLKDTRLHITVSYVGMQSVDKVYTPVKSKENGLDKYTVNLDSIVMKSNPVSLAEAEIVAELKKMYQRGDTVIFNAEAYEMPSGSVLLDLVRRLPGLKYDNGKITYMGRDIQEIKLNGDSFFRRDMSIALNNMPHDKLKSLKVYEVPDDTLNKASDKHLVMDMETKESMKRVIFADVSAGTTESFDHYLFAGNISSWKQKGAQIYGGFTTQDIPNQGTYQLKTLNTSGNLGYEQAFGKTNISANGNYGYNHNENKSNSYNKLFMPNYTQNSMSESTIGSKDKNRSGNIQASGSINDHVRWSAFMNLSNSNNRNDSQSNDSISNESEGLLRTTRQSNITDSNTKGFNISTNFNYSFDKKQHNELNVRYSLNHSKSENTQINKSYSRFVQLDSICDVNHRISTPSKMDSHNIGIDFSHHVTDKAFLRLSYSFNYNKDNSVQNYEDIIGDGSFRAVDSLHYDKKNKYVNHEIGLMYFYNTEKTRANVNLNVTPTTMTIDNDQYGKVEHIKYNGIRYSINSNYRYMFNKNRLSVRYDGSNELPGFSELSNVTDYSDPMNISVGNPYLKNSFNHNFGIEFQLKSMLRMDLSYGMTDNQITSLTILDKETGSRRTSPANIDGNWNTREYIFITKPIHDFTLNFTVTHTFNHNVIFVQGSNDNTIYKSATKWHNINCRVEGSYGDKYWLIHSNVGYTLDRNKSDYLAEATTGNTINAGADIAYQAPFGLTLGTTCNFNKPFGYEMAAANKTECILGLTAEYKFLKKKLATVKVDWRDILNSYNGFSASMSSTGWNENRTYGDTSMFVITFNYRLNDFD